MASTAISESGMPMDRDTDTSHTDFTWDLFGQCEAEAKGRNVVIAPHSVTTALAMACMGARGNTAEEMRQVLKWSTEDLPDGLGSGLSLLKETTAEKTTSCTLLEAQRIYVDRRFTLKPKFISDIQERFGSMAVTADFQNNPEAERQNINGWVLEQTRDKIPDLLPGGSVNSQTAMVLVQALYFKGKRQHQFDPRKTRQADFYSPKGVVKVHMMEQTRHFNYGPVPGFPFVALELPYASQGAGTPSARSMYVIVPQTSPAGSAPEDLHRVERYLRNDGFARLVNNMQLEKVKLELPRFTTEILLFLSKALMGLGMRQAFGQHADFSGMIEEGQLPISHVFHKVRVEVDEEGTEVYEIPEGQANPEMKMAMSAIHRVTVNHPFLFLIMDKGADNVMAMGRVVKPE